MAVECLYGWICEGRCLGRGVTFEGDTRKQKRVLYADDTVLRGRNLEVCVRKKLEVNAIKIAEFRKWNSELRSW